MTHRILQMQWLTLSLYHQHTITGPLSLNPHHSHNHAEKELRNNHRCVNVSMSIDESTLLCTF